MQESRSRQWLADSSEAIGEYEEFVEKHGCFADSLRSF